MAFRSCHNPIQQKKGPTVNPGVSSTNLHSITWDSLGKDEQENTLLS